MYITLPDGREIDIPDCTDLVESCEDCPRYMDDCDGKDD